EEIRFAIKNLAAKGKAAIEKIRLRERDHHVLALRAELDAGAEFLSCAGEAGPVQQIEIALRKLDEPDQLVDGAEARAEIKRAGPFLFYLNGEVLASGHSRVFRIGFHFREVAKIIEALLGGLDAHAVQNIPGCDQHFPAYHFVFRARVADDVDAL